jgi:sugar phosphate isomerase/epimerase
MACSKDNPVAVVTNMPKPEIGVSMLFRLGESFPSLIKYLRKVTTRQVEILDEGLHTLNSRRVKTLKEVAKSHDLELTVHAPFVDINIASPSPALRRTILKRLEKSVSYAGKLGCRLWVFHPGQRTGVSHFYPGLDWQLNIESMHSLLKTARKHEVDIAIENVPEPFPFLMKSVEDFSHFYDEFDDDLGLVLDVGHANINRQIKDFMTRFSEKIVHVHVSDNDGTSDAHLGIGYGTIDWEGVADALKKVEYNNVIMLESTDHVEESLQTLRKLFS